MLLLEYDIARRKQVNELLEPEQKFDFGNNKKYKIKAIQDIEVYAKEAVDQLPGLYYLVS